MRQDYLSNGYSCRTPWHFVISELGFYFFISREFLNYSEDVQNLQYTMTGQDFKRGVYNSEPPPFFDGGTISDHPVFCIFFKIFHFFLAEYLLVSFPLFYFRHIFLFIQLDFLYFWKKYPYSLVKAVSSLRSHRIFFSYSFLFANHLQSALKNVA